MTKQHQLHDVRIGDEPDSWSDVGFVVNNGSLVIDQTRVTLTGAQGPRGIVSVAIDGLLNDIDNVPGADDSAAVGIAVHASDPVRPDAPAHPNHITGVDHLVVMTPDCDRTTVALEAAGLEARRVRTFNMGGVMRRQTFFWMGSVILELVGPDSADGEGPPSLWGLALTTTDIDATASALGGLCTPPKEAIQAGRRISTLKTRHVGISTAVAIMTPHVAKGSPSA